MLKVNVSLPMQHEESVIAKVKEGMNWNDMRGCYVTVYSVRHMIAPVCSPPSLRFFFKSAYDLVQIDNI